MPTTSYLTPQPSHERELLAGRRHAQQMALLVPAPSRRLTQDESEEIRRAVAISSMAPPQSGETVAALIRELAEEFGVSVRTVLSIVRSGGRA
jgi:uncharacterized protein YggU (UPF0235/DUF167 family)